MFHVVWLWVWEAAGGFVGAATALLQGERERERERGREGLAGRCFGWLVGGLCILTLLTNAGKRGGAEKVRARLCVFICVCVCVCEIEGRAAEFVWVSVGSVLCAFVRFACAWDGGCAVFCLFFACVCVSHSAVQFIYRLVCVCVCVCVCACLCVYASAWERKKEQRGRWMELQNVYARCGFHVCACTSARARGPKGFSLHIKTFVSPLKVFPLSTWRKV